MQRSRFPRWAILWLLGTILLALIAGCAHHTPSAAPGAAPPVTPVATNAPPAPAAFQPYRCCPRRRLHRRWLRLATAFCI
jgi:hypothetical protein